MSENESVGKYQDVINGYTGTLLLEYQPQQYQQEIQTGNCDGFSRRSSQERFQKEPPKFLIRLLLSAELSAHI